MTERMTDLFVNGGEIGPAEDAPWPDREWTDEEIAHFQYHIDRLGRRHHLSKLKVERYAKSVVVIIPKNSIVPYNVEQALKECLSGEAAIIANRKR